MAIKIAAIVGFLAMIGFGVYFFWLRPAPVEIVQIPTPTPPTEPPQPLITPPVKPGSFFAEAPITRSLPPGFEFQKAGEGLESFETLNISSELPTPEEQTAKELERLGLDPLLTRDLPQIQWPSFEDLIKIKIPAEPSQKQTEDFVKNMTNSLISKGIIEASAQKDLIIAAGEQAKFFDQSMAESNKELDAMLNFSNNYVDDLIAHGLLAPEEKQNALEAVKSSAVISLGSQSNALGPLQNLPNY